jgi:hypothetical protein
MLAALKKCRPAKEHVKASAADSEVIPKISPRLARPPLSFRPSFTTPVRGFDGDAAAYLLQLDERRLDRTKKWNELSRAEQRRARNRWKQLDSGVVRLSEKTNLKAHRKRGRPSTIDSALILFCARVICEEAGAAQFKFSRGGGGPHGPMWRALMEALPVAQQFLNTRYGTPAIARDKIGRHAQTIAGIVALSRSKDFSQFCQAAHLGTSAAAVASAPNMFRQAIKYARRFRPNVYRSRLT